MGTMFECYLHYALDVSISLFCIFRNSLWSSFYMTIRGDEQFINDIPVRFMDITFGIDCFKYLCSKSCTQDVFDTNVACCLTKGSTTFITKRLRYGRECEQTIFDAKPPAFLSIDDKNAILKPCNKKWRNIMAKQFTQHKRYQYTRWRSSKCAIQKSKLRRVNGYDEKLSLWLFNEPSNYEISSNIKALKLVHTMLSIYQFYKSRVGIYESNNIPWHFCNIVTDLR